MLNETQAQDKVKSFAPNVTLKTWASYKNLYLIKVEWPSKDEKNFDPFFSVDKNTGKVQDFSILPDLDTIVNLEWINIPEGG